MEYCLMTFRNLLTAFFNFCSTIDVVEGVTITALLFAVFVLAVLFKRFHL